MFKDISRHKEAETGSMNSRRPTDTTRFLQRQRDDRQKHDLQLYNSIVKAAESLSNSSEQDKHRQNTSAREFLYRLEQTIHDLCRYYPKMAKLP